MCIENFAIYAKFSVEILLFMTYHVRYNFSITALTKALLGNSKPRKFNTSPTTKIRSQTKTKHEMYVMKKNRKLY